MLSEYFLFYAFLFSLLKSKSFTSKATLLRLCLYSREREKGNIPNSSVNFPRVVDRDVVVWHFESTKEFSKEEEKEEDQKTNQKCKCKCYQTPSSSSTS